MLREPFKDSDFLGGVVELREPPQGFQINALRDLTYPKTPTGVCGVLCVLSNLLQPSHAPVFPPRRRG